MEEIKNKINALTAWRNWQSRKEVINHTISRLEERMNSVLSIPENEYVNRNYRLTSTEGDDNTLALSNEWYHLKLVSDTPNYKEIIRFVIDEFFPFHIFKEGVLNSNRTTRDIFPLISLKFNNNEGFKIKVIEVENEVFIQALEPNRGEPTFEMTLTYCIDCICNKGYFELEDMTDLLETDGLPF